MGAAALLAISVGCAAMEPALMQFANPSRTPALSQSWSGVTITKPTPTPLALTAIPTAAAKAVEAPGTPVSEEWPVITMVIVEQDDQGISVEEAPAATGPDGKYMLVSLSEQHLYAYENGRLVYSFVASTGLGNSTRAGTFHVLDKIPSAYGANWNIWMPNWLGIYWSGTLENGIHALPILPGGARLWAGYLGAPVSFGCVVLGVDEASQLYDWAEVGTPVEIRW